MNEPRETGPTRASLRTTLLLSTGILLATAVVLAVIFTTEPTALRAGATKKTAMLVKVIGIERSDHRPEIVATGTVVPEQDIILRPQVGGAIIERAAEFVPGGFLEAGAMVVRIDPIDYRYALQRRQGDLHQALSDLEVERGRQQVARKDLELLAGELHAGNEELVLRVPQGKAAQLRVKAAQAAVGQAELALRRTTVRAPFAAQVITRAANVGSLVSAGQELGRLVGLDRFWVSVAVPVAKLRWLNLAGEDEGEGSTVRVFNRGAWVEGVYRSGTLVRLVGTLEDQTRLARVLVSVPDPLAHNNPDLPRLIIGEFVEVRIAGKPLDDVVRLAREHLRASDRVWVMEEGKLRIREVDVVTVDQAFAYIREGLADGDLVVTTNLSRVVDGAPLRIEPGPAANHEVGL